jgi:hypothetical protein
MRPMLKACGMSGLLIPLLERLGVRQSIRASGLAAATAGDDTDNDNDDRNKEYQLFVNISTSLSSSSFCLSLDEGGVLVPGPVGAPTRAVSSWGTVAEGSPRESNVADAERRALFTRRKTTIIICIYPLALAAVAISSAWHDARFACFACFACATCTYLLRLFCSCCLLPPFARPHRVRERG